MLNIWRPQRTFQFNWRKKEEFNKKLLSNHINKVVMVVSTIKSKKFKFNRQERLPDMLKMSFLKLEKKKLLKNKIVYVFNVIN